MAASTAVARAARSWNGPGRQQGVDLARGLAVIGMLAAHLLWTPEFDPSDPSTLLDVVNGRSSILFATLAGVSLAILTGGRSPYAGARRRSARWSIVRRAGVVWLIGVVLILTGVPVYVILPAYAILFVLALPLLSLPVAALWTIAAAIALVVPWVMPVLNNAPIWQNAGAAELSALIGWEYPFVLWLAFIAAGIALGRSRLDALTTQIFMLVGGGLVAAAAYLVDGWTDPDGYLGEVWTSAPHSSGVLESVGSGAFAVAVLGLCLLVCRTPLTWVVLPLRAVGTMPLTAYAGQIFAWAIVATIAVGNPGDLVWMRELDPFIPFAVGTIVLCTVWALTLGRGPVERLMRWAAGGSTPATASATATAASADRVGR